MNPTPKSTHASSRPQDMRQQAESIQVRLDRKLKIAETYLDDGLKNQLNTYLGKRPAFAFQLACNEFPDKCHGDDYARVLSHLTSQTDGDSATSLALCAGVICAMLNSKAVGEDDIQLATHFAKEAVKKFTTHSDERAGFSNLLKQELADKPFAVNYIVDELATSPTF